MTSHDTNYSMANELHSENVLTYRCLTPSGRLAERRCAHSYDREVLGVFGSK